MASRSRFACLALVTALVACTTPTGGTDIGNGIVAVQVDLQGYDGRAVPRRLDTITGDRIDEAMIAIERLRLEPGDACADEVEEEEGEEREDDVIGPILADLAGEGVQGGPLGFDVADSAFCELRLDLHASDQLDGAAVRLRGARVDGVPFEVHSEEEGELSLRSRGEPFSLVAGDAAVLLAFDLGAWVEAIDLGSLEPGPDGVIRIAEDSEDDEVQAALERFDEAVRASVRLVRDGDGDAALDAEEQDETLAD